MPEKLVTAMAFSTLWEAEMARSRLDAEGVPAFLKDGQTINMHWLLSNALGGVKLQVPESELERAKQLLSAPFEVDSPEEEDPECLIVCPRCSNKNIQYRISGRRWTFLTWVLCGIPLIWPRKKLYCGKCGYSWNETDKLK